MEQERQEEQTEAQEQEIKDLDVEDEQAGEVTGGKFHGDAPKE